jgi:3',5'-cyclic-AMP phosphodiesterase
VEKAMAKDEGIGRRGALECMAWAAGGLVWTVHGGVPVSRLLSVSEAQAAAAAGFSFVQMSDSHVGFNKEANPDVTGTLREAVAKVNALQIRPAFVLHTGDVTHLSQPGTHEIAADVLGTLKIDRLHGVPGEHDIANDGFARWKERWGKETSDIGWVSFDEGGVHFVGLNNVTEHSGRLGALGDAQLGWLEHDLAARGPSTPIVVFAHVPLWSLYPDWGWATADSERAMALLKRFGSVTVLNGHIHQTMQKVEGNVAFHTAPSTAFPQPAPGTAPSPGPMTVPAERLRQVLGITEVNFIPNQGPLAVIDDPLARST